MELEENKNVEIEESKEEGGGDQQIVIHLESKNFELILMVTR